ncbi:MAG: hypothetical protein KAZ25_04830, partial [Ottowia sp.]|nr:hypothetical protein [Ottowia sp.]
MTKLTKKVIYHYLIDTQIPVNARVEHTDVRTPEHPRATTSNGSSTRASRQNQSTAARQIRPKMHKPQRLQSTHCRKQDRVL